VVVLVSDLMERICHARDEEFGPECGKESTRRDETGNTYCALHDYLAAISGELTFPIDATQYEMESHRAAVYELAEQLRGELMTQDLRNPKSDL